jgi:hypothetical protein
VFSYVIRIKVLESTAFWIRRHPYRLHPYDISSLLLAQLLQEEDEGDYGTQEAREILRIVCCFKPSCLYLKVGSKLPYCPRSEIFCLFFHVGFPPFYCYLLLCTTLIIIIIIRVSPVVNFGFASTGTKSGLRP